MRTRRRAKVSFFTPVRRIYHEQQQVTDEDDVTIAQDALSVNQIAVDFAVPKTWLPIHASR